MAPAAGRAGELLASAEVVEAWEGESVLPAMTAGALAGHLARSVLQVEWFLDGRVTGAEPVSAVHSCARLTGTDQPGSTLDTGVRARSAETAAEGPAVVAGQALRVP
ncbi:hypothetical protein [Streptomyces sp. CS227]|uniref:hypothetical protein n=1 Tax=Streptomyces sp. CS227 TaxID=1982763 RepID=UPI0015C63836|nr:hypothetical protein [Streptomyces sp. CS227]